MEEPLIRASMSSLTGCVRIACLLVSITGSWYFVHYFIFNLVFILSFLQEIVSIAELMEVFKGK